jgi:alpha-ribazole phosphatase/probable phosphoglycerate mutase
MSRVLFIRHAETEMAGRFCGHSDPDLNAQGRAQLTGLARALSTETIAEVYSSDLRRAQSTAQTLAAGRNVPLTLRPALREIHFGEWEGLSWEEIEQLDPEYARRWVDGYPYVTAPAGETFQEFEARILDEVSHLLHRDAGSIAVVTHAGVLRVVLRHLHGCSEQESWQRTQPYCCVVRYEPKGENQ